MKSFSANLNPRKWILSAFALTVPTLLFWWAVAVSLFTRNHTYVDAILFGGNTNRLIIGAVLPLISFGIALLIRMSLRVQAIERNVWHRETPEMKVNQGLINWNVLLISVMIISLINN